MKDEIDRIENARKSRRWYWDKNTKEFVERRDDAPQTPSSRGLTVMGDIQPYLAVGMKDPKTGKPVVVGGRRQHRDELRARNLVEVGNETSGWSEKPNIPPAGPAIREQMARMGLFDGARSFGELKRQGRS